MAHTHHLASQPYWIFLILTLTAALYVRGWLHVGSSRPRVIPTRRAVSFFLGLFLIWVAMTSPIAGLAHELLTFHMVQHLVLMTFAAPLIWLGDPLMALVHCIPRSVRVGRASVLRWPSIQRPAKAITHPVVCWLGATGVLVGWHIPRLYTLAMQSPGWHAIMEASFLITGLLFWWPIFQPWPSMKAPEWLVILYLFLATLPCDILSGFLVFSDRVVYPGYASSSHLFGFSPLGDQQFAGALMWTVVTVIYFVVGGIISAQLLSPQGLQQGPISLQRPVDGTAPLTAVRSMETV